VRFLAPCPSVPPTLSTLPTLVKIPSHVGIEGNVEADRLANQGRESSPLYPKTKSSNLELNYGTQSPRKKRKVDIEDNLPTSPFLSRNESPSLLCLVPLSNRVTYSNSDFGSEAAEPGEREYSSSGSDSTAPTDSEDASSF